MAFDGNKKREMFSLQAEQAVLGALIYENKAFDGLPNLRPEHFYDPVHGLIFETIVSLLAAGKTAGLITLDQRLSGNPGYQELHGRAYLERIAATIPSTAGLNDFAEVVINYALRRGVEAVAQALSEQIRNSTFDDDPRKMIDMAEEQLAGLLESGAQAGEGKSLREAFDSWMERIQARDSEATGHLCGLRDIDEKLNGFRPGKLYIVAGRPGQGKTTLLNNLAAGMAEKSGIGVGISTLEMEAEDIPVMLITDRMRNHRIKLSYLQAEKGIFSDDEFAAFTKCAKEVTALPIKVDDSPGASLGHIRRFARRTKRKFAAQGIKMGALIVDYLGLIEKDQSLKGTEKVAQITQGLLKIGREMDIAILCGCQLNRELEKRDDKRPSLSDLRESGDIEQDAFSVLFVYRPSTYHEKAEPKKTDVKKHQEWQIEMDRLRAEKPMEVIIGKHRRGPTGTVQLWCEIETAAIRNRDFNPMDPLDRDRGGFA